MLINNQFCGFLVVRLPRLNSDEAGRGAFPKVAPCIGSTCYAGVERMSWFDVEEDFYSGVLPGNLRDLYQSIRDNNNDFTGLPLCSDLGTAIQLLEYSNRQKAQNEIIALRSPKLTEIKGMSIQIESGMVLWRGFDVISLGNWSLLMQGVFAHPELFSRWMGNIEGGLIKDLDAGKRYALDYEAEMSRQCVEELPESQYGIDSVEVGSVIVNSFKG